MVHAKIQFLLNGAIRHALLTDRGWTVIHDAGGMSCIFNLICPLAGFLRPSECAHRLAELVHGAVTHVEPEPATTCPPAGLIPDCSPR